MSPKDKGDRKEKREKRSVRRCEEEGGHYKKTYI